MDNNKLSIHNTLWGTFLILLGLYFFAPQLGMDISINFSLIWPLFLLVPGFGLWLNWLVSKNRGKEIGTVIPATILSMLGGIFLFSALTDYQYMDKLAFMFPLSVAMGFWFAWLLGSRHIGFLIPAAVLTLASIVTLGSWFLTKFLFPVLLIAIGVSMVFKNPKPKVIEVKPVEQEKEEKKEEAKENKAVKKAVKEKKE